MIDRRLFNSAVLAFFALPSAMAATAQGKGYPTRTVWIITPAPTGVGPDVIARTLASQLADMWNEQVLVANKPGAGGLLGLRAAAEAPTDGYNLYLALSSTFVSLPERIDHLPLDVQSDLVPIALVGVQPMVITASAKSGIDSLRALVAAAKKHPNQLNYGANQGSLPNLAGELFKERANINLTFVPYSNMHQAMQDAVGGTLQVYIESIAGVGGHLKAGTLKGLAVAATHRLADYPELPTVQEALPEIGAFEARGWLALVARKGAPRGILDKVSADVRSALVQTDVVRRFRAMGTYVEPMSPTQLAKFIRSEQALWRPVARRLNRTAS